MQTITVPIRTPNPLNGQHGHWARKAKLRAAQRKAVAWSWLMSGMPELWTEGMRVRFVRCGPGILDDDNLRGALKAVRDEVAARLGIDDKLPIWDYAQERARAHSVRIEIE